MSDRYRDQRAVYGAPPPPRVQTVCEICSGLYHIHCTQCRVIGQGLVDLGHAIARFVRYTEVNELVYEATDACLKFGDTPDYEASTLLKHAARHGNALRRLAQLAKGQ